MYGITILKKLMTISKYAVCCMILSGSTISIALADNGEAKNEKLVADVEVSGLVTDEIGNGLPGATVSVRGTTVGTVTDLDGKYKLSVPEGVTLVFSFIGYVTKEIEVSGSTIDVQMELDTAQLEEIVVIGYGSVKKSDLTGSVSSVKGEELTVVAVPNVGHMLQGRAAGVQVQQNSAEPGGDLTIRIRGGNSINGANNPLVVIDGFVGAGDLNSINPNDIASIEVLKDASSTAIFGARGANGVILITTKRGKQGAPKVEFSTYYGQQLIGNKVDLLNGPQFGELQNDIAEAQGRPDVYPNPSVLQTTDWQDESIRNAAIQNHNLSISGGSNTVNYFISGDYFKQDGINRGSGFERFSLRTNLDIKASEKLSIGLSMLLSSTRKELKNPYGDDKGLLVLPPTLPVYNPDGTFNFEDPESSTGVFLNPIAFYEESIDLNKDNRLLGNFYLEYKIIDDLTLRQSFGLDVGFGKEEEFIPSSISLFAGVPGGIASLRSDEFSQWSSTTTLNYAKTIGANHSLRAIAVFEAQKREGSFMESESQNFPSDALTFNNLGAGIAPGVPQSGISSPFQLVSWLARINYTFANKYLFTATGRYDGSSRFGEDNKYAFFPSFAIGWKLSEEAFLQNAGIVDNLKLRVSWGETGNQEIGSFRSLVLFRSVTQPFRQNQTVGFKPRQMANPNLKWETTTQTDVGLDFGLWDNRLRGSIDYYYKETTDLLLNADIPSTSGFGSTLSNVGSVENKGWDFEVEADIVEAKIRWTTGLILSANKNKVLDLGGLPPIQAGAGFGDKKFPNTGVIKEGEEIGVFLGYRTDGIWQSDSDIQNSRDNPGVGQPFPRDDNTKPGDYRYIDHNGDGKINEDDIVKLGSNNPDITLGWSNTITYGNNLSLDFLVTSSLGYDVWNVTRWELISSIASSNNNALIDVLNRWTPENPTNEMPAAGYDKRNEVLDLNIEEASYVRLRNITLSYYFPVTILEKVKISGLRIYGAADNLFTITDYTGSDPEVNVRSGSNLRWGADRNAYARAKSYRFGLVVTF